MAIPANRWFRGIVYFGIGTFQVGAGETVRAVKSEDGSLLWRNDQVGKVTQAPPGVATGFTSRQR